MRNLVIKQEWFCGQCIPRHCVVEELISRQSGELSGSHVSSALSPVSVVSSHELILFISSLSPKIGSCGAVISWFQR